MEIQKHPGGRPTKFVPEMVDKALKMARCGLVIDQIAALLEVSIDSIYEYSYKYPEFSEAIKRGRAAAGGKTVLTLFQQANGYWGKDSKGERCWYPPVLAAGIFLSKNFAGLKDRVEVDATIKRIPALDVNKLTDEELKEFIRLAEKAAPSTEPIKMIGE